MTGLALADTKEPQGSTNLARGPLQLPARCVNIPPARATDVCRHPLRDEAMLEVRDCIMFRLRKAGSWSGVPDDQVHVAGESRAAHQPHHLVRVLQAIVDPAPQQYILQGDSLARAQWDRAHPR